MSHVTFVYPAVGRFPGTRYVRSWQMQPLAIAALSALTPPSWDRSFQDDRLEPLSFDDATDLVAISAETFTARRAYQIAAEYRKRNTPVVIGGYHPTFCPDEAQAHADAVCVGEAEPVWAEILRDTQAGRLATRYDGRTPDERPVPHYDRTIFDGKRYFKIALVEAGRGCRFDCSFCAITAFHRGRYHHRPVVDVVAEVSSLREKTIFLVDDNIVADPDYARALFEGLRRLNKRWVGQASINVARDPEMLDLMKASGCAGLLIGFESLDDSALTDVNKHVNLSIDYERAMAELRSRGFVIYGTFMLGLPSDSAGSADRLVEFAKDQKMFIAAFNHVVPFPGTPLYAEMERTSRLTHKAWWLSESYRFGDPPFRPQGATPDALREWCHSARRRFYSVGSILHRALDFKANCKSLSQAGMYLTLNALLRREITQKRGLPLGVQEKPACRDRPERRHEIQLRLATNADDPDLKRLMAGMPMPGMVEVAYQREPSFFTALQVEGIQNQVIIGRDSCTGEAAGMGTRSLKPAYVNGRASTLGYLSSLRVSEKYRGTIHLARGYEQLRQLHRDGRAELYLSTMIDDNKAAHALTKRRARLPAYHDIGLFRTVAVSLSAKRPKTHSDLVVRPARKADIPETVRFLEENGPRRQFFPMYREQDFCDREGLLCDLMPENILMCRRGGSLEGIVAAWDQKSFRQSVVTGYPTTVTLVRPLWNGWAKVRGLPRLPAVGTTVNAFYLSLVCIRNDDPTVFESLLACLMNQRRHTNEVMLAGTHERDPLFPTLAQMPHLEFLSRVYVVCWDDGENAFAQLDDRVPYLELGAL